jgi:predicted SAM-dependent methyltransferase
MSEVYAFLGGQRTFEKEAIYCTIWTPENATKGLDLGCGKRKAASWLLGIDYQISEQVDIVADVRKLPFENNSQDIVVSIHCLEHFANPISVLIEWYRVLRVGGRMALVVPDWRYTYSCHNPDQIASSEGHKVDYTLDNLVRIVIQTLPNMELIDARVVNYRWSVGVALEKL